MEKEWMSKKIGWRASNRRLIVENALRKDIEQELEGIERD